MSKRTTRQLLITFALILALFVFLGLIPLSQFAYAEQYSNTEQHLDIELHEQTKIYSRYFSSDYYLGCEDYDNYSSTAPSITFFTPGLGSSAAVWSNTGVVSNTTRTQ